MVGKAFQAEVTASMKASGGNTVSKRKRVGNEVRKATRLTSRRDVVGLVETLDIVYEATQGSRAYEVDVIFHILQGIPSE